MQTKTGLGVEKQKLRELCQRVELWALETSVSVRMNHSHLERNIHEKWKRGKNNNLCTLYILFSNFILFYYAYYSPYYIIYLFYITNIYWGIMNAWLCSGLWVKWENKTKCSTSWSFHSCFCLFTSQHNTETLWKQEFGLCLNLLNIITLVT